MEAVAIYLGRRLPAASSGQPGDGAGRLHSPPIWPCSGWGLPSRPVARPLVRSCRTFSPLPALAGEASRWRFGFCGTFRRVTPPGRYPAPCPVEPGLSSRHRRAATRPTGAPRLQGSTHLRPRQGAFSRGLEAEFAMGRLSPPLPGVPVLLMDVDGRRAHNLINVAAAQAATVSPVPVRFEDHRAPTARADTGGSLLHRLTS